MDKTGPNWSSSSELTPPRSITNKDVEYIIGITDKRNIVPIGFDKFTS